MTRQHIKDMLNVSKFPCETFYYGRRLKATLQDMKTCYIVKLYGYKNKTIKEKMFLYENENKLGVYRKALYFARNHMNTCKY